MSNRDYQRVIKGLERLDKAPQRKKVFFILLQGQNVKQIAKEMKKTKEGTDGTDGNLKVGTVSKMISQIYRDFGITQENSENLRKDLIDLIKSYKPELLPPDLRLQRSPPRGILPLNSPLYIERNIEKELKEIFSNHISNFPLEITQIKGLRGTGKSNLLFRLHHFLKSERKRIVGSLDLGLQSFSEDILSDLDSFLYQFTRCIKEILDKETATTHLFDYWQSKKGENIAPGDICTDYLRKYVFSKAPKQQKYLLIDGIDIAFNQDIRKGFENVIRSWNEQYIKSHEDEEKALWPNIIIAYSTGAYATHGIQNSPLANVGSETFLEEFTQEEVLCLAARYGIDIDESSVMQLMELAEGHPELIQLSLHTISRDKISVEELISIAISPNGPFSKYLRQNLILLEKNLKLAFCFMKILQGEECGNETNEYQLERAGLIKRIDIHHAVPACKLYKIYYQEYLQSHD
jgi:hypothetical protein